MIAQSAFEKLSKYKCGGKERNKTKNSNKNITRKCDVFILWYNFNIMKEGEYYSKRIIRGLDNAFAGKRESLLSTSKSIYEIVSPESNVVKRVQGLFSILRKAMPEQMWNKLGVSGALRDFSHFPFDLSEYELKHRIGSGYQCDCYLFEPLDKNEHETWALKVFQNIRSNLSEAEKKAKQVNEDYTTLADWYKEIDGLIPKQIALISEHFQKPRGRPTLVLLQKFLGSDVKDLAQDFNEDEWNALCERAPQIKEQLKKFVLITKSNIEKYDKIPDLLGDNNLVVVDQTSSPRLVFLDSDGIGNLSTMAPKFKPRYKARLNLLYKRAGIS